MPSSTWRFTVKFKLKNGGSTMTSSMSNVSVQVQSHQSTPTDFEKTEALKKYIESKYRGWTVVDMDITNCSH